MASDLQPNGNWISVGNVRLRTPGLSGRAESYVAGVPGMRAAEQTTDELETALANEDVQSQETIEVTGGSEIDMPGVAVRSTTFEEPAIEVEVPDPGDAFGQFVLHTDEAGVTTWNFARDDSLNVDVTRGAGTRTYVIRRSVPEQPATAETRGLIGAIGKRIIKVLAFPIAEVTERFAAKWEAAKRPYRVRTFTPDDYRGAGSPVDGSAWGDLAGGRALLLIHGTFSQAHSGFGGMSPEFVADLHRIYSGRVFAFDHFTLSDDPRKNIEWLLEHIPDEIDLELDVICHSRGGLVSRVLAERVGDLSVGAKNVAVRNVVFVAAPNAGTVLVDTKYMGDFIDSHTNILNFYPDLFPGGAIVNVLEGIITVAKQIAVGAVDGLEGLQSMNPRGPFLNEWLNRGPGTDANYFALAASYEPTQRGWRQYVKDRLMDRIFGIDNDLVVPTAGVWDSNGSGLFPIDERHVFTVADGVQHSNFFSNKTASDRVLQWLSS
jgi:hypothetical protein